jgi:hypothetical protein
MCTSIVLHTGGELRSFLALKVRLHWSEHNLAYCASFYDISTPTTCISDAPKVQLAAIQIDTMVTVGCLTYLALHHVIDFGSHWRVCGGVMLMMD